MQSSSSMTRREAVAKALTWRFLFSIPPGALITWAWMGNPWKSLGLMIFLNTLYTFVHYFFEKDFWPRFWKRFDRRED